MLGLGFAAAGAAGFLPAGGVLVLDVDALETPLLPSCFVGDFAVEYTALTPALAPGVGLLPIALALFPGPSARRGLFNPLTKALLGRLFAGAPLAAGLVLGFASSTTSRTPLGRRNMPCPCSQSKYRSPLTEPSFFPVASSSSTPTQSPVWKCVVPTKRTVATRPSLSSIFWPTERDEAFIFHSTRQPDISSFLSSSPTLQRASGECDNNLLISSQFRPRPGSSDA